MGSTPGGAPAPSSDRPSAGPFQRRSCAQGEEEFEEARQEAAAEFALVRGSLRVNLPKVGWERRPLLALDDLYVFLSRW